MCSSDLDCLYQVVLAHEHVRVHMHMHTPNLRACAHACAALPLGVFTQKDFQPWFEGAAANKLLTSEKYRGLVQKLDDECGFH